MELSGIPIENFPPVMGNNDSKTLRKLSLLEARMIGAGGESRDGSLPPNDGSRGSDNNSNSMSTIGFAKPRGNVGSPGGAGAQQSNSRGLGGVGGTKPKTDPPKDDEGGGKRKALIGDGFSPPRAPPQPQNAGTPSTLSTSPGGSRDWNNARHSSSKGPGDEYPNLKRARTEGTLDPPPPPPPPRFRLPQAESDRQAPQGGAAAKGGQGHARRRSRGAEGGGGSPTTNAQGSGRLGARQPLERPGQGLDQSDSTKDRQGVQEPASSDAPGSEGALPPPPPPVAQQGGDLSPPSGGRSSRGAATTAGITKTIQSYFFKPSNGSAVQDLASSYAAGDPAAPSRLPAEVDLSGVDGDSPLGQAQPIAKLGRSGSSGVSGGYGESLQRRFSHAAAASAAGCGDDQALGQQAQGRGHAAGGGEGGTVGDIDVRSGSGDAQQDAVERLNAKLKEAKTVEEQLRRELTRANLERSSMESMAEAVQKQLDRKVEEFKAKELDRDAQKKELTLVVERLLRKVSAQEASDCRAKLARDILELGNIVSVKTGHIGKYVEAFEDGSSFKRVESKAADMLSRKAKLEARKRAVSKLLRTVAPLGGDETVSVQAKLEAVEEEETVRMHLAALKREEAALQEEKRALDARKILHIRELKRVAHEDRSKFSKRPTLSGRYVLLNLLGKGGFSEVWRAFDLVNAEDVAVKVHQLLNNWNEPQKANFIRHVTREYEIHQQMRHPRIVNLTDVFEICCDSFATVLDYCRGTDLECLLRERKQLPERDARALVLQVARGLQYLNTAQGEGENRRGAIIHYDLKPGNILLDENCDVKITDFGLSKILEIKKDTERGPGGLTSMELTSKGAGTYWYLPPECFGDNPRISSKVDVWSLGVVFYQMLYGVRPFGEGLSQEKILREKVIVNANRVEFPSKPVVSEEAKSFIRSCLTYTHATRPDVHAMCVLPYLATPAAKRGA